MPSSARCPSGSSASTATGRSSAGRELVIPQADAGPHPRPGRGRGRRSRRHRPQGRGHGPGQRRSGHRDALAGAPHVHGPDADAGPRRRARDADSGRTVVPRTAGAHRRRPRRRRTARRRDVAGDRPQSPARPQRHGRSATAAPSPGSPPATPSRARPGRRPRAARRRCLVEPGGVLHHARGDRAVALRRRGRHRRCSSAGRACAATVAPSTSRPRPIVRRSTSTSRRSTRCCRRPASASSTRWSTAAPAACGSPIATPHRTWCACRSWTPRRQRRPRRPSPAAASASPTGSAAERRRGVLAGPIARRRVDVGHAGPRTTGCSSPRPLHRLSFGSPLVSGDRVVGLVASPTTAWSAALVATAASARTCGCRPRLSATELPRRW